MIYAESREAVEHARIGFARKWKLRCKTPAPASRKPATNFSPLPLFRFRNGRRCAPPTPCERINEEFRRRTKTQASLPSEEAVLLLLFGLLRSGQVTLRRLVGWHDLATISEQPEAA